MTRVASKCAIALLWTVCATADCRYGDALTITASVAPIAARPGEFIAVEVTLANRGDTPLLVPVAESNFVLAVAGSDRTELVEIPHYTSLRTNVDEACIPLRPGSSYRWLLPVSVNSFDALPGTGWLGPPGSYSIRITYQPTRSRACSSHVDAPVACQAIESSTLPITISPPSHSTLASWRRVLAECLHNDECATYQVTNPYRVIRDPAVGDLLLQVLMKDVESTWNLDAIVFQGRRSDAVALRTLLSEVKSTAVRDVYLDAITKLESKANSNAEK